MILLSRQGNPKETADGNLRKCMGSFLQLVRYLAALQVRLQAPGPARVFVCIKLYRQMYANTGIATDSARRKTANGWARWTGAICLRLFRAKPMPDLQMPVAARPALTTIG